MFLNPLDINALNGVEAQRSNQELVAITQAVDDGLLPADFPISLWTTQANRYKHEWSLFRGDVFNEVSSYTPDKRPVYRYPLKINPIRTFARKHAALLFGETPDTPLPLVKHVVLPKELLYPDGKVTESDKQHAKFLQQFSNEIWQGSYGRSTQYQNGLLSQFLGGSVFQSQYQPWRKDLLIPIAVKPIFPDFFLPVWSGDDWWNLLEAWVVYNVPAASMRLQYGIDPGDNKPNVLYVEHWKPDSYSILVDGKPLVADFNGTKVSYDNVENPFDLVPFTYIPRLREGNFYGNGFVEDIEGLALEYNARYADLGDAIRDNVQRLYWGRNIQNTPRPKQFDNGRNYVDLGQGIPGSNHEPELAAFDAPQWSDGFSDTVQSLWLQMGRETGLGPIAFGEDEGSQRSALTLAFRMWPSTAVARSQRVFWTDGMAHIGRRHLMMAAALKLKFSGQTINKDDALNYSFAADWLPIIPRDREAQVNEILLRLQAGAMSLEKALEDFGDVPDIDKEVLQIKNWLLMQAKFAALGAAPGTTPGSGAPAQTVKPMLNDHLKE